LSNAINISGLFVKCSLLKEIPDISKWKLCSVTKIYSLFYEYSSLKELPDISKWDINKVNSLAGLFVGCSSLEFLPDISKWNINNNSKLNNYLNNNLSYKSDITDFKIVLKNLLKSKTNKKIFSRFFGF